MKTHTSAFKNTIKKLGRELDSIITYELNGATIELGNEILNSVSPHYEGSILKSVMKVLDIDSNIDIPLETVINYQFGVKIRNDNVQDYRDNYDYINFGNYVVYKSEKQEDTNSYKITCYDKMLYSMKEYENLNITYPITIRDYISAIANYMNVDFANETDTFANYDKQIPNELYLLYNSDTQKWESLGYTFRDVLDELAEVTASTICINDNDELEIRYITDSGDTIDEEYLKDINVNFGKQTDAINTIVLSRSGGTDKIYMSYPTDLPEEQRVSIEITDNQILNNNNRDTFMSDILNTLLGFQYYINNFSSTGICYYDLCDRYNVVIDNNTYSCVMLNDSINITTGLKENIYTDMLEESVTDYTKADTTDRRINQTYFIVDKQNQTIQSVVSSVGEQDEKISQITQTVNEINSKISDISDITTSNETTMASMTMEDINTSEPIQLKIYPIGQSISYLYPRNNLYPSSTLFSTTRLIRFHNNTTNDDIDYILPEDLLYYDSNNYDEFSLDYGDGTSLTQICQVTKKCKYNADGTVGLLTTPETHNYTYPTINLTDGDYTISLLNYNAGYIYARLMAKNIYTTQFYTKVETNSLISQTASDITLGVNQTLSNYSTTNEMNAAINIKANEINQTVSQKVGNNEIISKINQTPESITINANKLNLQGYVTASDLSGTGTTVINGSNITTGTIDASQVNVANINASNITSGTISANKINGGTINASSISLKNVSLGTGSSNIGGFSVNSNNLKRTSSNGNIGMGLNLYGNTVGFYAESSNGDNWAVVTPNGGITNGSWVNGSLEKYKKNFEKYENALDTIKNIDIYKYNLKQENDTDKKHIGFVIGKKFNYNKDITTKENDGVDLYSFISVCCQAIKEQQEIIEDLTQRIEKLERESDK